MAMGGMTKMPRTKRGRPNRSKSVKFGRIAPAVKDYVKKAIASAPEVKYSDQTTTFTDIIADNVGVEKTFMTDLEPAQGTGEHDRIGHKIKIKSFQMRGRINTNSTNTDTVRLILAYDSDSVNDISDYLKTTKTYAIPRKDKDSTLRILYDKVFNMDVVQRKQQQFSINKKLNILYDANKVDKGDFVLYVLGTLTNASGLGAVVKYDACLTYTDA